MPEPWQPLRDWRAAGRRRWPTSRHSSGIRQLEFRGRRRRRCVALAEAVREEGLEGDLLLANETGLGQFAVLEHVEDGADSAGRGDLNGAAHPAAERRRIDLVGVSLLHQL